MKPIVQRNRKTKRSNVRSDNSPYLFSGDNAVGEPMFVCGACGGNINGNQVATRYYYLCSSYKNKGIAGCNQGQYIQQDKLESKVLMAIRKRFSKNRIQNLVREFNATLDDALHDQDCAETHILNSIEVLEKSIANIVKAIEQGSATVPALVKRLEQLQEERHALEIERAEIKKDRPLIPRISEETITGKVRLLQNIFQNPKQLTKNAA